MGGIRKPPPSSTDPDPTLSEIFWHCISKHRTCWLHLAAYLYHHEKKITLREVEDIKKRFRGISPCFSRTFPHREHSKRRGNHDISTHGKRKKRDTGIFSQTFPHHEHSKRMVNHDNSNCVKSKKLDTAMFEQYMESLWRSIKEDKKMSFDYLDSLWFSLYQETSSRPKVLKWIKQKGIFSKKYVFVPIVCWSHWSLLIFVNFAESLNSETGSPCVLLLDSLEAADPRRLEPEIRKFVADIYRAEERTEDDQAISQIPLLVPKVPQQRNDVECGNYVLYFINLFMEAAPENFSILKGYPYFMKQDWFDSESLEYFCNKLQKELPKETTETNSSPVIRRKSQRRGVGIISMTE